MSSRGGGELRRASFFVRVGRKGTGKGKKEKKRAKKKRKEKRGKIPELCSPSLLVEQTYGIIYYCVRQCKRINQLTTRDRFLRGLDNYNLYHHSIAPGEVRIDTKITTRQIGSDPDPTSHGLKTSQKYPYLIYPNIYPNIFGRRHFPQSDASLLQRRTVGCDAATVEFPFPDRRAQSGEGGGGGPETGPFLVEGK